MRSLFILMILAAYMGQGVVMGSTAREVKAKCEIKPGSGTANIGGVITLTQTIKADNSSSLKMDIKLTGFNSTDSITQHGFHAHVSGNLSDQCAAAGGHYNPDNVLHGGPTDPADKRHVGDFGNINETSGGIVENTITVTFASLVGERSIVNRSLVVHETFDDLGLGNAPTSNTTGNSGKRLGCCVIVLNASNKIAPPLYTIAFVLFLISSILSTI